MRTNEIAPEVVVKNSFPEASADQLKVLIALVAAKRRDESNLSSFIQDPRLKSIPFQSLQAFAQSVR